VARAEVAALEVEPMVSEHDKAGLRKAVELVADPFERTMTERVLEKLFEELEQAKYELEQAEAELDERDEADDDENETAEEKVERVNALRDLMLRLKPFISKGSTTIGEARATVKKLVAEELAQSPEKSAKELATAFVSRHYRDKLTGDEQARIHREYVRLFSERPQ
jgi:hypothetical protein